MLKGKPVPTAPTPRWKALKQRGASEAATRCSVKISALKNFHRKTPVLEFLFNKVAGLFY